ncbi:MAG: hypothetical protein CL678_05175 [Bdellovibrionaceae bacterium]|nr:hypothetical protein [Pseudobdellovibrionaceae bacterium]
MNRVFSLFLMLVSGPLWAGYPVVSDETLMVLAPFLDENYSQYTEAMKYEQESLLELQYQWNALWDQLETEYQKLFATHVEETEKYVLFHVGKIAGMEAEIEHLKYQIDEVKMNHVDDGSAEYSHYRSAALTPYIRKKNDLEFHLRIKKDGLKFAENWLKNKKVHLSKIENRLSYRNRLGMIDEDDMLIIVRRVSDWDCPWKRGYGFFEEKKDRLQEVQERFLYPIARINESYQKKIGRTQEVQRKKLLTEIQREDGDNSFRSIQLPERLERSVRSYEMAQVEKQSGVKITQYGTIDRYTQDGIRLDIGLFFVKLARLNAIRKRRQRLASHLGAGAVSAAGVMGLFYGVTDIETLGVVGSSGGVLAKHFGKEKFKITHELTLEDLDSAFVTRKMQSFFKGWIKSGWISKGKGSEIYKEVSGIVHKISRGESLGIDIRFESDGTKKCESIWGRLFKKK